MLKSTLTLVATIFLFSGCAQDDPQPLPEKEVVFVNKTQPKLKNLDEVDIKIPVFQLYKEEYNATKEYDNNVYIVNKEQLILASSTTQMMRHKLYLQDKQLKFYKWQNTKINNLNKKK